MKQLILVAIATLTTIFAGAQIQFGAKGGLNLAHVHVSDPDPGDSYKLSPGFHLGGLVQIPLSENISLQPELFYSAQGVKATSGGESGTLHLDYINLPVLVKYKTASGFFVELGPQLGVLVNAKAKSTLGDFDVKDEYSSTDISGVLGLGFQFSSNIGIDGRYSYSITNILKDSGGYSARNGVIQIGVFYLFGGGGK